MGWHLLSSFWVPGPMYTVASHHEMRAWMETGQRTKVGSLLLKTSGTVTPDGRSQDRGTLGKLSHPSEPQPPLSITSALHPAWGSTSTQEAILAILTASIFGHHQLARNITWTITFHLANKIASVLISVLQGRKQRHKGTLSHLPRVTQLGRSGVENQIRPSSSRTKQLTTILACLELWLACQTECAQSSVYVFSFNPCTALRVRDYYFLKN